MIPKELMDKWDQINREIRALQREMGITPRTLEQRAADWNRKQAELVALEQQKKARPKWMTS